MESQERGRHGHVIVIPYPGQGHINPMFQFSKRLASKGPKVTLLSTISDANSVQTHAGSITVESFSGKFDKPKNGSQDCDIEDTIDSFRVIMSKALPEFIAKQDHPVSCIVYDAGMPWALDIAKRLGLVAASFFTQSCSVIAIYYHFHQGLLTVPTEEEETISLPGLPPFKACDLPSFIRDLDLYPYLLDLSLYQFLNIQKADWIFFNSFESLEHQVVKYGMARQWPIKTIGPTIPSMYLDKRYMDDEKDYGLNLFKPNINDCMKWLDTKETGSVVYVAFGSLAKLEEEQMVQLALGLRRIKCYFIWVVRESELNKLPRNFSEETLEKGLVVTWCLQLDVLAHRAVGCFMTHCGWNSTVEGLSFGVPMVVMPQWVDQMTNAKFVVDVWKVGVRVKVDEKGIVRKEEVEKCINEVMEGERGIEIKKNASMWKELAKEAVDEGGSSDKNIEEFVASLVCNSH